MADFLANLAGRTLSTEPSPRPVVAPMFAAGPMMAGESLSETVSQESLADGSLSSLMPRSARLEQPGLAPGSEEPAAAAPGTREFITQRVPALAGQQQAVTNQQVGPGSVTPRVQMDFSPVKESSPLIGTRTSIPREQPGARLYGSRREMQQASASAPVIKVSIGRIDVRAITPPASTTSQKPSSTRPQPSLEEYLQARNRGKR